MLLLVNRFLVTIEFFRKYPLKKSHTRFSRILQKQLDIHEKDISDFFRFFYSYFGYENSARIDIPFASLNRYDSWEECLDDLIFQAADFFLISNSGILDFFARYKEFDLQRITAWAKVMNINPAQVRKLLRFYESIGVLTSHKKRFHLMKRDVFTPSDPNQKCIYMLPNFEVILLDPTRYELIMCLLKYCWFEKMNYEIVFHIDQDQLFQCIHSKSDLEELRSIIPYLLSEMPGNIAFTLEHIEEELNKMELMGEGVFYRIQDKDLLDHFAPFFEMYPGQYQFVEPFLFIAHSCYEAFVQFCEDQQIMNQSINDQSVNTQQFILERMQKEEVQLFWEVLYCFSYFLNRFRLFDRFQKNRFDQLLHLFTLIHKSENDITEKALNQQKREYRSLCEEKFENFQLSLSHKMGADKSSLDDDIWDVVSYAFRANSRVNIFVKAESDKFVRKKEFQGYIFGFNQLCVMIRQSRNGKSKTILWNDIDSVTLL